MKVMSNTDRLPSLWITYSWLDNQDQAVEYIAQEIQQQGVEVRIDKWTLRAGQTLWQQIGDEIRSANCNGWAIYATQNSLTSPACTEELYYALGEALASRGNEFPLVGIFPEVVSSEIIPPVIRSRLYVTLGDEEWVERVVAAVEGRAPSIRQPRIEPYVLLVHFDPESTDVVIEMRPRVGRWDSFFVGVPPEEVGQVLADSPNLRPGSSNKIPHAFSAFGGFSGQTKDGQWWYQGWDNPAATPNCSYYLFCKHLPSMILFGGRQSDQHQHIFKSQDVP